MAEAKLSRLYRNFDITLSTATSSATTVDMRDVAGAVVSFGTMSTNAATLQMWGATSSAGTYRRLYKADGTAADLTLTPSTTDGRTYALPDEVFAVSHLKLVSGTTASSGVVGVVGLKS
jgi:hypothetical protein